MPVYHELNKTGSDCLPRPNLARQCGKMMFLVCSRGAEIPDSSRKSGAKSARRPVSRVLSRPFAGPWMTIPLGRPSPDASRDLPGRRRKRASPAPVPKDRSAGRPYAVLLPVGFALPPPLPAARCALTAPFHPCRARTCPARRFAFCGTVPGVAPAGRYPAPCFRGARTFLPPALAGREAAIRPSGADDVGRRKSGVNVLGGVPLGFSAQIDRFDALDFHRLAQCKNRRTI